MFCGCELSFGDEPNIHTCPICLAHPGTLPVPNGRAIELALQIAIALGLRDRPAVDLPPQELLLSRQPEGLPDQPVRLSRWPPAGGSATCASTASTSRRTRRSSSITRSPGASTARARRWWTSTGAARRWSRSSPSPTSHDPAAAREWLALLRTTIRQIGASDVNMEEGSLRCDANVSLRPAGQRRARDQDRAQEHEQLPLHRARDRGRDRAPGRGARRAAARLEQETLHFDPRSGDLTPLRSKEYSHDYRYFPEPDLVPLVPTEEMLEAARASLPELPAERRARYAAELGLPEDAGDPARLRRGARRPTSSASPRPPPTVEPPWSRTGSRASSPRALRRGRRRRPRPAASASAATIGLVQGGARSRTARPREVLRDPGRRGRRSGRDRRARGARGDRGRRRARGDRRAGDRGRARRPPRGCATATRRRSARWSAP